MLNVLGSLEDLVNTFDEKITECFRNYDENVENLAPVQIRSQEEVMSENQWVFCLPPRRLCIPKC